MGSEAKCRLRVKSNEYSGTALLETDEVLFRSNDKSFRLRIPLASSKNVLADGATLRLTDAGGRPVELCVGERVAARWAAKIASPPSLFDKLGVVEGAAIALHGALDATLAKELGARGAKSAKPDLVFLGADDTKALERVAALRAKLADDAALWIVYPKGRKDIREADVLSAGRAAGLKDVKTARVSDTHTALKFVVPLADRSRARALSAKRAR